MHNCLGYAEQDEHIMRCRGLVIARAVAPLGLALTGCACRAPRAGKLNSNGSELLVFGKQYGKVFIGVQPTFGYEGDPMRLLFSRSASPHHGFAAYYTYLEKIFKVGAPLVHAEGCPRQGLSCRSTGVP